MIGGWVVKYFVAYMTGDGGNAAADGCFTSHITGQWQPRLFLIVLLFMVAFIIFRGGNKAIESFSKVLMPLLVVGIVVFSLTIQYQDEAGVTRTGLESFWIYVVPLFNNYTYQVAVSVKGPSKGQFIRGPEELEYYGSGCRLTGRTFFICNPPGRCCIY